MSKNVLIVTTNQRVFPGGKSSSGVWLSTIARFARVLEAHGYHYTFISPKGGEVQIDKHSLAWVFTKTSDWEYYNNEIFRDKLLHTLSPKQINARNYDAIYFSGGYGTLEDFPNNQDFQNIAKTIYENGGVIAAIAHGVSGLLNIRLSNGLYLLNNKQVTGFSNLEETLAGNRRYIPFSLENELKKRGAIFRKAILPYVLFLVSDRQVITGQSPCASGAIAKEMIRKLHNITDSLKDAQKVSIQDNSKTLRPGC
jgi:putative intracellular protease/amidase